MAVGVRGHTPQSEPRAHRKPRVLGVRTEPIVETNGRPGTRGQWRSPGEAPGYGQTAARGGPMGGCSAPRCGAPLAGRHVHAPAKARQGPCRVGVARDYQESCDALAMVSAAVARRCSATVDPRVEGGAGPVHRRGSATAETCGAPRRVVVRDATGWPRCQ